MAKILPPTWSQAEYVRSTKLCRHVHDTIIRRAPGTKLNTYRTQPKTEAEIARRAAEVQAEVCGSLRRDPRDDGPGFVVGRDATTRAAPIPPTNYESPAQACRRYLRLWRAARLAPKESGRCA